MAGIFRISSLWLTSLYSFIPIKKELSRIVGFDRGCIMDKYYLEFILK